MAKGSSQSVQANTPTQENVRVLSEVDAALSEIPIEQLNPNGNGPSPSHISADNPTIWEMDGFKFRLLKIAPLLIYEIGNKVPQPKIPVVMIEDKGREEENPNDPAYRTALREWSWSRGMALSNAQLAMGTRLLEHPVDKEHYSTDEWISDLEYLDVVVPKSGAARYVTWLKLYALNGEQFNQLLIDVQKFNGLITEEAVAQAEAAFRDIEEGNTTPTVPTPTEN